MKKTLRISRTINPFLSNYAHEIICFDFTSPLEEIKTHFSLTSLTLILHHPLKKSKIKNQISQKSQNV